ncbi:MULTISPECIES: hypothetical protein [Aliagarivorans]|uniref:hypothetical protein n=1 Tax=Aliagarivorans TaxID=882379 RepID=UPI00040931D4|nr:MULTISPECIES: hypothetical protein [Aliagarivorans]
MRFQQLKELLDHFESDRRQLIKLYRHLENQADDERVRMLLSYLQQREHENCQQLKSSYSETPKDVLETWVDLRAENDIAEICSKVFLPANMHVEEVLAVAVELEGKTLELLNTGVLQLASMAHAKEYLENLLEHQQKREQQLVHSAHRMDDI